MNRIKWAFAGLAIISVFVFPLLFNFPPSVRNGLILASTISFINVAFILSILNWAFKRSNKIFYGTFFGGMVWKLLALSAIAITIYGNPKFSLGTTLVSMACFTLCFTLVGFSICLKSWRAPA